LKRWIKSELGGLEQRMDAKIAGVRQELHQLGLKLTVRLGAMLAAAIAVLGVLDRLA
jgi:hypothetical protein